MGSSATLRQVADLAQVSMGTASQAINNRPNVAPETRSRVLEAARTLGYPLKNPTYAPDAIQVIGLLTKHDLGLPSEVNPFYSHIQAGVESECRRQNLSLMYANIEVDRSNHPVMWPAMISEQRIDGLILAGTFIEDTIDWLQRRLDVPIVLVDSYATHLPFDSVVIDNTPGAMSAVNYLIEQGHQHIGLVGWNEKSPPSIHERYVGYCRSLHEHGISDMYLGKGDIFSRESGYESALRLLRQYPKITAIFGCNDLTAIGCIQAARELGLRVPQDLSVAGFDNIDLAQDITPALTTVHVYKTWMGILSTRQLLERAQNSDQPKITITLTTRLIVRESVQPVNHPT